jgi:hypothetical protein
MTATDLITRQVAQNPLNYALISMAVALSASPDFSAIGGVRSHADRTSLLRCKMAFTDFTLEAVEIELGVTPRLGLVFPHLPVVSAPDWLTDGLARGRELALVSEKARSEFIVAPVLLGVRELSGGRISILSGQRLDVDPERRLLGECDFILSLSEPLPRLRAPLATIVEAKKNDIEAGLGQCIAQMVAAQLFNERAGRPGVVYGCVTTGEDWQFLRLDGQAVLIDTTRRYINDVGSILAAFLAMPGQAGMAGPNVAADPAT